MGGINEEQGGRVDALSWRIGSRSSAGGDLAHEFDGPEGCRDGIKDGLALGTKGGEAIVLDAQLLLEVVDRLHGRRHEVVESLARLVLVELGGIGQNFGESPLNVGRLRLEGHHAEDAMSVMRIEELAMRGKW